MKRGLFSFCSIWVLGFCGLALTQPSGLPPEAAELWKIQERMTFIEDSVRNVVWDQKDKEHIRKCDNHKHEFLKEKRENDPRHEKIKAQLQEAKKQDPRSAEARKLMEEKFKLEQQYQKAYESTRMGQQCEKWGEQRMKGLEQALKKHSEYQKAVKQAQILRKKLE